MGTSYFKHDPSLRAPACPFTELEIAAPAGRDGLVLVERTLNLRGSVKDFMDAVRTETGGPRAAQYDSEPFGMCCDGRRGLFKLHAFPVTRNIYAVDCRDQNYVCVLPNGTCLPSTVASYAGE